MLTAQRIDIAGRQLAYTTSSGTGRPVVFLHGNSSSSLVWHRVLEGEVGDRHRCFALDLPGHGKSDRAAGVEDYSLPGYAAVLAAFLKAAEIDDAVIVGWSLGGHVALEAAPHLDTAAGFVICGSPPIGILATDGAARLGLGAGVQAGHFADEVEIVGGLTRPLAVLHGEREQLVNLEYVRGVAMPSLWRGEVQVVPAAGHTVMIEAPQEFSRILGEFLAALD